MPDSKIKFSVEGITDLHQSFQKILDDSKAITKVWEVQGESVIKSLQQQIELLKQRNSYGSSVSPYVGGGSQRIKDEGLTDIEMVLENISSDGVLIHKDSLRELAEMLKNTTPTTAPDSGAGGGGNGTPGGAGQEMNRTSQFIRNFATSTLLNPLGASDPVRSLLGAGSNVGTALMGMGGPMAIAGAAVSAISNLILARYGAIATVAPTAAEASRILGGDWASWTPAEAGSTRFGLQRNDILQRRMQMARAMGRQDLGSSFEQSLLWEMTTMLSSSDIAEFARSGRGERGFDLSRNMGGYFEMLRRSGVSNEKIQTQMSEYLRELVSLNQMQLDQFGQSSSTLNSALYSMFATAFPEAAQSNPALVGRLAGGFFRGMSSASSRQIEALQYLTASRIMGSSGSWYQARMMREDPFGLMEGLTDEERERRLRYSTELLSQYRSVAGGTEQFAYLLEKQFGFSSNQAMRLAQQYDKGQFNIMDYQRKASEMKAEDETEAQMRRDLPKKVDDISQVLAQWESLKIGGNVDRIRQMAEGIYKLLGGSEGEDTSRDNMNWWSQMRQTFRGMFFHDYNIPIK